MSILYREGKVKRRKNWKNNDNGKNGIKATNGMSSCKQGISELISG